MAKVSAGIGGRGTVTSMERKSHPNSHFEIGEMRIQKAHDGSFVIKHDMRLKKKHEGKGEEYMGSYREPETHTAASKEELMAHVQKHYGGKAKGKESEPDANDENEAEEGDE